MMSSSCRCQNPKVSAKRRASKAAWRKANPDKHRAWKAASYWANPDKHRAYAAAWRKANPDKQRASNAASYWANPDKIRAKAAAWRKANAEQAKAYNQLRRAALKGAPGPGLALMKAYWKTVRDLPCVGCGVTGKMTLDHIIPLSKGGHHAPYNVQPLCHSCNSSKGAKNFAEWLASRQQVAA